MNDATLQTAARRAARALGVPPQDAARVLRNELAVLLRAKQEQAAEEMPVATPAPARPQCARYVTDDDGGSYVRIPYMAKSEDAKALQKAIGYPADKMGLSHYMAAEVMTYFLEGIADQVSLGRVVRIPGFGMFGPNVWRSKDNGRLAVYPRFVPARPFRLQVRAMCEPAQAQNEVLSQFQRSHHPSSRPDKVGSTTWKTMHAWREQLRRQAGYDVGED